MSTMSSCVRFKFAFCLLSVLWFCGTAQAATYLNQTRLIVHEKEREVTFSLINQGKTPALMQLWTDRDNLLDRPEQIKMPFLILPPVFRLEAGKSRVVRLQLINKGEGLAKDKESVFWLNALEVPPRSAVAANSNLLQMAFRTRIKLFFRPAAIASATLQDGVKGMQTSRVRCATGNCLRLISHSPLHITLLNITFDNGKVVHNLPNNGMIAPFSLMDVPLPDVGATQFKSVAWVDDYGVENSFTK
ncbi:fimbrial biogenesis chaperone [Phytobacter sp. V91]|uniref:fimbrial biogenesis chaperone n=1 Tax=Phytobacter sp. V91 TaxID=3369425 RepID=UPI003F614C4B